MTISELIKELQEVQIKCDGEDPEVMVYTLSHGPFGLDVGWVDEEDSDTLVGHFGLFPITDDEE